MKSFLIPWMLAGLLAVTNSVGKDLPLEKITLPEGFVIEVFAAEVPNARAMALGDRGTLFVGSRREGKVYAVVDLDNDNKADQVHVVARDLKLPTGIAFNGGSLFIGAVSTIYRLDDIENRLENPPELQVVSDQFPSETHHGWKYLGFGPDGKLYVPVGAPCNVCLEEGYAEIQRMNPDGSGRETIARGVRNTVGFDWHPQTGDLWFTDNGRDLLSDDVPPCELNHLSETGQHFGFPYCHGNDVADPEFGEQAACADFRPPVATLGAHVAPLGMAFYTGQQFPDAYRQQIVLAEHGSWNRSKKSGYKLTLATLSGDTVVSTEPFAHGWLNDADQSVWGRPVDVLNWPDGSLLVSDDTAGVIYRIHYSPQTELSAP